MRGTYSILLTCSKPFRVKLGCLDYIDVNIGNYVYTGSALGKGSASLERRIERHRQRSKPIRWHIDYLTCRDEIQIKASVYVRSRSRLECMINKMVLEQLRGRAIARHAGASDCRCSAHLVSVRGSTRDLIEKLKKIYTASGDPIVNRYS